MATTVREVDCAQSVNDIITRHPATMGVFNRFGLDRCCGGSLSVEDAARAHGVNREELCDALHHAVNGEAPAA